MKKYIFFDLDGTLTDSEEGIVKSLQIGLKYFNINKTPEELRVFIGPPLPEIFSKGFNLIGEDNKTAVREFRSYYNEKGLFENRVYDGIPELLEALNNKGYTLAVATSKPEYAAKRILEHFDLSKYFYKICGSNVDETRSRKAEVIEYCLEECGISQEERSNVLMIGDRKNDIAGGHEMGLKVCYCLFGYGSREEAESHGSDYICETVEDLKNFLLNL